MDYLFITIFTDTIFVKFTIMLSTQHFIFWNTLVKISSKTLTHSCPILCFKLAIVINFEKRNEVVVIEVD
jgi:hypothetical protein